MNENVDDIKKELDEVRKLKEELRREVEDIRREKEDTHDRREESRQRTEKSRSSRGPRAPRPPHKVPPVPPLPDIDIDLSGITDSLEDMMDGLGKSIERSIKGKSFRIPGVRIHKSGRRRRKKVRKSDIEKIPPERVAKIVAPLGSEERLKIMEFLKGGGKTFNEIEIFTEKTGSSLTHHLNPLVEAGYVVKGEVRGTYYLTVEGRLAYRLSQWLTHRVETQRNRTGNNGSNGKSEVTIDFEENSEDDAAIIIVEDEESLEKAADHLDRVADEVDKARDEIEEAVEEIEEAKEARLEESEEADENDDMDDLDWKD